MANKKRTISSFNLFLVIQLVIMMLLSVGIAAAVSVKTQKTSSEYMSTLARERSQIIKNYVEYAENTLKAYSHANQIIRVLENPDDPVRVQEAQNYTETFSADIDNLEGIYVSKWSTEVIAHTNSQVLPLTTRPADAEVEEKLSLGYLQDRLREAGPDAVYNAGIIISPATHKQIISLYMPVYKNGNPCGLVGMGLYTENLVKTLDDLSSKGNENFRYNMINVYDNTYIFSNETETFRVENYTDENGENKFKVTVFSPDDKNIIDLCNEFRNAKSSGIEKESSGEFKSYLSDGKFISTYNYMDEKYMNEDGWLFIISQPQKEYYSLTQTLVIYLILFSIFCIALALIFSFINRKQEETNKKLTTAVKKNVKTKETLNTALFNDILTDANNRVSFSTDFSDGKVKDSPDYPYYFALFNICGFSDFNIRYGNEFGDMLLVKTADSLRSAFPSGTLYRTGSDEFVVAVQSQNNNSGFTNIQSCMNKAISLLSAPINSDSGQITVTYRSALVKKSKNINAGVITALKDISNKGDISVSGQINFADLDSRV